MTCHVPDGSGDKSIDGDGANVGGRADDARDKAKHKITRAEEDSREA